MDKKNQAMVAKCEAMPPSPERTACMEAAADELTKQQLKPGRTQGIIALVVAVLLALIVMYFLMRRGKKAPATA